MNPVTKPKQIDTIKNELLAGNKVNSIRCFKHYGITRLASVICRLRGRCWPIESQRQQDSSIVDYSVPEVWRKEMARKVSIPVNVSMP